MVYGLRYWTVQDLAETLEKELETYRRVLPTVRGAEGKYVLIGDDQLIGLFGTYEAALISGYKHFGVKQFLVKKIWAKLGGGRRPRRRDRWFSKLASNRGNRGPYHFPKIRGARIHRSRL
jgi:hypothetical protein